MKMKVLLSLMLSIILLGTFAFSASAQTDSYTVVNGGSSVKGSNDVKLGATGTNWSVRIDSYSFNGLPSGIFGDNVIVTRMRTPGDPATSKAASATCTYSSTNSSTVYFKSYFSGYGAYGDTYTLCASMSSGPSTGGTLSITWQA